MTLLDKAQALQDHKPEHTPATSLSPQECREILNLHQAHEDTLRELQDLKAQIEQERERAARPLLVQLCRELNLPVYEQASLALVQEIKRLRQESSSTSEDCAQALDDIRNSCSLPPNVPPASVAKHIKALSDSWFNEDTEEPKRAGEPFGYVGSLTWTLARGRPKEDPVSFILVREDMSRIMYNDVNVRYWPDEAKPTFLIVWHQYGIDIINYDAIDYISKESSDD